MDGTGDRLDGAGEPEVLVDGGEPVGDEVGLGGVVHDPPPVEDRGEGAAHERAAPGVGGEGELPGQLIRCGAPHPDVEELPEQLGGVGVVEGDEVLGGAEGEQLLEESDGCGPGDDEGPGDDAPECDSLVGVDGGGGNGVVGVEGAVPGDELVEVVGGVVDDFLVGPVVAEGGEVVVLGPGVADVVGGGGGLFDGVVEVDDPVEDRG